MKRRRRTKAESEVARQRVLAVARKRGRYIDCDGARTAGGWNNAWYHLKLLCEQGLMVHADRNRWELTRRAR